MLHNFGVGMVKLKCILTQGTASLSAPPQAFLFTEIQSHINP